MNTHEREKQKGNAIQDAPRLTGAIHLLVSRFPGKLNRETLCKYLYYADGHYFQKKGRQITEFPYIHVEGSPMPLAFNLIMARMVANQLIKVTPVVKPEVLPDGTRISVLRGMRFEPGAPVDDVFDREERKVLNSVASLLKGDLSLETRYFPNLYQNYTQTGLYEEIPYMTFEGGRRPHLSWKAWSGKIFRLMGQ